MSRNGDLRRGRHCVFLLHVHLVFVTKYRQKVFEKAHLKRLEEIFRKVCRDFGAELVEFNGEADHVHLLINYPPKVAVSRLVNSLKGVFARLLRRSTAGAHQKVYRLSERAFILSLKEEAFSPAFG